MGRSREAEATITIRDDVLADIIEGKLHAATALLQRKIGLRGKLTAIAKFRPDIIYKSKL